MSSATPLAISTRAAARLALARAGLLGPRWSSLPRRSAPAGARAAGRCQQVIERFGYLQLDAVSVSGARSHALVLAARLQGLDTASTETLLERGTPLFEYWGHEACWMPLSLYPLFAFRRREFRVHPWWGELLDAQRKLARELLARVRDQGELRSVDLDGERGAGWWNLKLSKRVAEALWSTGELAIAARRGFQRVYDLAERVIPADLAAREVSDEEAYARLLLQALDGHGWASTGTLAATWRLRNRRPALDAALARLCEEGAIVACRLHGAAGSASGWIRPAHLELAGRLERARLSREAAVLLSPFDPLLWDRARTQALFGFEQVLEIYKPAPRRRFGYYVMPVLAGDRLVARVDLKAERAARTLRVLSWHFEQVRSRAAEQAAVRAAIVRHAAAVRLAHVLLPGGERIEVEGGEARGHG